LYGAFVIGIDSKGTPRLGGIEWHSFLKTDKTFDDTTYVGETDYVNEFVPKLKQILALRALIGKTVAHTSLSDASSAALALVTATEETAKIVTPPHGIGGPIDVATITKAGTTLTRH
jgi:hypothetical protein